MNDLETDSEKTRADDQSNNGENFSNFTLGERNNSKDNQTNPNEIKNPTKKNHPPNWANRIQAISSLIMVLITTGILTVTYFYTQYASQQVDETRNAIKLNEKAIELNKESVDIAAKNLTVVEDHFKFGQRAWLSIKTIKLRNELKANEQNYIDYNFINTGQTPALKVKIKSKAFIQNQPHPEPILKLNIAPGEGAHGPNIEYNTSTILTPFTEAEINDIKSGKKFFSFNIEITYSDIFDDKIIHHTTACGFFDRMSKRTFDLCDYGNDMD